jgi:hypothetical protein
MSEAKKMNVFGIDYQRTLSVVCLRETARVRSVGDGFVHLIPNAVSGEEQWGSRALLSSAILGGAHWLDDEAWLNDEKAPAFWRGMFKRFYQYLGHLEPIAQNGYHVVIALQVAEFATAATKLAEICQAAGFRGIHILPAPHALLCRYLVANPRQDHSPSVIVAVVVGDTSTSVTAFRVGWTGRPILTILESSSCIHIKGTGQAHWIKKIVEEVQSRLDEELPATYAIKIRDAAIEFGAQLSRAKSNQRAAWSGPMSERLARASLLLTLTKQECAAWPEAATLLINLPRLIRKASAEIGGKTEPDLILVGGVGAVWHFAGDAAANVAPVWKSGNPQEDLAQGATWWHELALGNHPFIANEAAKEQARLPDLRLSPPVEEAFSKISSQEPADPIDELPPWQRDEEVAFFESATSADPDDPEQLPPWLRDHRKASE